MEIVEPIRDEKKIRAMSLYLKGKNIRDYTLFIIGINSALRISDLLKLRVEDVQGKERLSIKEQKTGKTRDFPLSDICRRVIKEYINSQGLKEGYLFLSRSGQNRPLGRIRAWCILSEAAHMVGIKERIGTHTLRKTFGYWAFKRGAGIEQLQKLFAHSSPGVTLAYIGITRDEIDDIYINLNLGV